jgi:hypothetical protein
VNGYNGVVDADCVNTPEAFAAANRKARLEHLRSLTLEKAAEELEAILNSWSEIEGSREGLDLPPRRPKPFPGPTLAILLEGKPSPEE